MPDPMHQAAEKHLKSFIVAYDLEFEKTHNSIKLLKICSSQSDELQLTSQSKGSYAKIMSDAKFQSVLAAYFANRGDIAFAFLFGSQASGRATKLSDVDLAVYFYPEKRRPVQYQEEVFYNNEDAIWSDLEKLTHKEVELLVLNRVSASIAASAIRGIPLAINDGGLYLDFMEAVTSEAEDFREMIFRDFLERMKRERRAEAETIAAPELY